MHFVVVERPVTEATPHRSGRAELPHPALQIYLCPRKTQALNTNLPRFPDEIRALVLFGSILTCPIIRSS